MDATGILKQIGEEIQVSDKFTKREFVLTIPGQYPQHVTFQLTQGKCSLIESFKVGDEVKVAFNLQGKEYRDKQGVLKHFNSLGAWKIELVKQGSATSTTTEQVSENNSITRPESDLPF